MKLRNTLITLTALIISYIAIDRPAKAEEQTEDPNKIELTQGVEEESELEQEVQKPKKPEYAPNVTFGAYGDPFLESMDFNGYISGQHPNGQYFHRLKLTPNLDQEEGEAAVDGFAKVVLKQHLGPKGKGFGPVEHYAGPLDLSKGALSLGVGYTVTGKTDNAKGGITGYVLPISTLGPGVRVGVAGSCRVRANDDVSLLVGGFAEYLLTVNTTGENPEANHNIIALPYVGLGLGKVDIMLEPRINTTLNQPVGLSMGVQYTF
jgi:hypothetical protein